MFARALVAFDGSAGSRRALELGLQLAAEHGTAVTVLTVEAHLPHYAATVGEMDEERRREEQQAHRVLTEASALAAERGAGSRPRPGSGMRPRRSCGPRPRTPRR